MKKVCVVTAARSEYGPLRWIIDELHRDSAIELQLVVTGAHLVKEQGYTCGEIERDGYSIAATVDMSLDALSTRSIARSMGICAKGFSEVFDRLKPDLLVILGDRYELLPICSTALVMDVPIAHISGGDVTEGAIDDAVRNAVTMMADLHFPGNEESAKNIERMRGSAKNINNVGEPGLDNFNRLCLMTRDELSENLSIDANKKWVLMTYHPETRTSIGTNLETVKNIVETLRKLDDVVVVMTKANVDYGGRQINDYLQSVADTQNDKFILYASLGQLRYLSFMKQASLVIGNSSSGIVEAPFCGIPTINVGDRQKGRYMCQNVVNADMTINSIEQAINISTTKDLRQIIDANYYGNGTTAQQIIEVIKQWI